MFKADRHERTAPDMSPDGKSLAFILDRTKLCVMDVKSGKVRQLTDGSTNRSRGGAFNFVWSPDSKWIALEVVDKKHDPYSDIALINVADGTMTNITQSGYFDSDPKWCSVARPFSSHRSAMVCVITRRGARRAMFSSYS